MDRHLRIAVADDELDMRDYLQAILPCFGHLVVAVASTGRELVEKCRQERPDLVITDIKMPDMDGIAAAGQICKDFPIPVILVSAYHDHDLLEAPGKTTSWRFWSSRSSRPTWSRPSPSRPGGSSSSRLFVRRQPTCARPLRIESSSRGPRDCS